MLKCTGKKTNAPLLTQDKLKYSHQQDTDLVQAHSITVNQVRPLVETTGTASVMNLKRQNLLEDTFYPELVLAIYLYFVI